MVQCEVCLFWKVSEEDRKFYGGLGGRCQKLKKWDYDMGFGSDLAPGYINWYRDHEHTNAVIFHAEFGCVRGEFKDGYPRIEFWISGMDFPVEVGLHDWPLAECETLELTWTRQPYYPEGDVCCKYFHSADVVTRLEPVSVDGDKYIFEYKLPKEEANAEDDS